MRARPKYNEADYSTPEMYDIQLDKWAEDAEQEIKELKESKISILRTFVESNQAYEKQIKELKDRAQVCAQCQEVVCFGGDNLCDSCAELYS